MAPQFQPIDFEPKTECLICERWTHRSRLFEGICDSCEDAETEAAEDDRLANPLEPGFRRIA
jgi:hypothetical protein